MFGNGICEDGKGTEHGPKLALRQSGQGVTITDIGVFDQLKRVNHGVLFSSEINHIITEIQMKNKNQDRIINGKSKKK